MAEIKIKADSNGGTVSLKGPASTTGNAAIQLTLPVDDGAADQYLKTNGSGVLSWATVSQQTNASNLSSGTLPAARIADDSIVEAKLDIHAAPSGTDKFLGYTSNGMEWAAVPKGWEQVTRATTSGDQDIETTALFDGTYNQIMICLEHVDPSADGTDLGMRFKIDGSYVTTGDHYKSSARQWESDSSSLKDLRNDGTNDFKLVWNLGNASDEWSSGRIWINGPDSNTTYKTASWQWWGIDKEGHAVMNHGAGALMANTNPLQGVKIYGNYLGNLGAATISTYGMKL